MVEDIYDLLNEYISTFKDNFKKLADETFNALADEAQVDVEANRETCRQIYTGEKQLTDVSGRITMWTILCFLCQKPPIFLILTIYLTFTLCVATQMLSG